MAIEEAQQALSQAADAAAGSCWKGVCPGVQAMADAQQKVLGGLWELLVAEEHTTEVSMPRQHVMTIHHTCAMVPHDSLKSFAAILIEVSIPGTH